MIMAQNTTEDTLKIGYVIFPSFQPLDVFGPLDMLNILSFQRKVELYLIAATTEPVHIHPRSAKLAMSNSNFDFTITPTHSFETAMDLELNALFVPGGLGTGAPNFDSTVEFVRAKYPSVDYMLSVCTGASILARAGILDGRNATTNKRRWAWTTAMGPKTNWIARARWVEDGNVWTTSGVAAGIDGTLAWIQHLLGEEVALDLAEKAEYDWHRDANWDPFAERNGAKDVPPQ